jgi:uncharacterized protein (TIRG00374 family)
MRALRWLALLGGVAVLAVLAAGADLPAVGRALAGVGAWGAAAVAAVFLLSFVLDTAAWQLALPSAGLSPGWLYRLWRVRMVGEAFNLVIPAGSVGGEPVKALLLKQAEGIGYKEGGASLVIAKTVLLLALLPFVGAGLALMARAPLPAAYPAAVGGGLAALGLGVLGFYAVQRWRLAGRLATALAGHRLGRRLEALLDHIHEVDDLFVAFYAGRPGRFAAALALAFLAWALGAVEIYLVMGFLGRPVGWAEAWMLEAVAQLVRAGTFFIPGSLGASEAGFLIMVEALTGQAALGLALALVRRGRELVWIAWGFLLAWLHALRPGRRGIDPEGP